MGLVRRLSALTKMQLRSCYDLIAGAALKLRLCCALKPLLCESAGSRGLAAVDQQPSNKVYDIITLVTMIHLVIINQ